jgi:hypothetical protein
MNMKPLLIFIFLATVIASPLAYGQLSPNDPGVLSKTTFGKSQNDDRDLANSLVPGPQKYGKGEKKQLVSAADLKSKSIKDSTFGGSLLNIGIPSTEPKLDEAKLRNASTEVAASASKEQPATTEKESNGSKQTATVEKGSSTSTQPAENQAVFSSLSTTATLAENLGEADAAAAASQSKTSSSSTATSATTTGDAPKKDQGAATTSTDKSSTTKPDGDH